MENVNNDLPPAYCSLNDAESTEKKDDTFTENSLENSVEMPIKSSFENDNARIGFMIKVLSIDLMQVMASGFIIGILSTCLNSHMYWGIVHNRRNLMAMATLLHLSTLGALLYCSEARKRRPYNFMFLAALPLTMAFSVVVFTCDLILIEIATVWSIYFVALLAQLIFIIFCLDGPLKFRVRNGIFLSAGILVVFYLSMLAFARYLNLFTLFYLTVLVLLECSILTYRLDLMTSKEYHYALTPSDYVTGALCIHSDTWYIICSVFKTKVNKLFCKE